MTKTTTLALTLLLGAMIALPHTALAGKPDRNPSDKECPNADVATRCSDELDAAYDLVGWLLGNNAEGEYFLSRNPANDAGTLQCKISGAELKLYQGKDGEASSLLDKAIEKIWSLYGQGKLSYEGLDLLNGAFGAAKSCIDGY